MRLPKMKKAGEESPAVETQFSTPVTMNEYLAFVKQKLLDQKLEEDTSVAQTQTARAKFPGLIET